jgi:hypothetical protein
MIKNRISSYAFIPRRWSLAHFISSDEIRSILVNNNPEWAPNDVETSIYRLGILNLVTIQWIDNIAEAYSIQFDLNWRLLLQDEGVKSNLIGVALDTPQERPKQPSAYHKGRHWPYRFSLRCFFGFHTKYYYCKRCGEINKSVAKQELEYNRYYWVKINADSKWELALLSNVFGRHYWELPGHQDPYFKVYEVNTTPIKQYNTSTEKK